MDLSYVNTAAQHNGIVPPDPEDDFLSTDDQSAMTTEQLQDFKDLLQNLEASKKRQQRQRSIEGRRDIYAQGLASMMSNF